jgi:hypothetical protein
MLTTVTQLAPLIASGQPLLVAGDEDQLRKLPRGNWIGGTIPYFMTDRGGVTTRELLFVQRVPEIARGARVCTYDAASIDQIALDSPEPGYTLVVIPAFSAIHESYALHAPEYPQLFMRVIGGFVAGVHLDDLPRRAPTVFAGPTGASSTSQVVAMHVALPESHAASLGIVNIFEQGDGDEISFPRSGFAATDCLIDGRTVNFHDYLVERAVDIRAPLVADFFGTKVNVSFQALDAAARTVKLYAPVFENVTYRLARPLTDYAGRFAAAIPPGLTTPAFSCNCVLNYLYGELEGRRTGSVVGPMTFGEIGYQLLNQTLVYIEVGKL